jgi:hypothetical protein
VRKTASDSRIAAIVPGCEALVQQVRDSRPRLGARPRSSSQVGSRDSPLGTEPPAGGMMGAMTPRFRRLLLALGLCALFGLIGGLALVAVGLSAVQATLVVAVLALLWLWRDSLFRRR